jgi:PIN domain nuclease of toxin-antitoxin system
VINLDTHIVLDGLLGKLKPRELRIARRRPVGISAVVLWEIAQLYRRGRTTLSLDHPKLVDWLSTIHVWPVDLAVCRQVERLDFSSDPADEIIAATSIAHDVPLLTRDERIHSSRKVPFA